MSGRNPHKLRRMGRVAAIMLDSVPAVLRDNPALDLRIYNSEATWADLAVVFRSAAEYADREGDTEVSA